MSSGVTVAYNGNVIHQMAGNGNFKMNTAGAYMEGDVDVVVDVSGGGGGYSKLDVESILTMSPSAYFLVPFYKSATNPTGYTLTYSSQNASSTPAWAVFNSIFSAVENAGLGGVRWTANSANQWVQIQLPEAKKINCFWIASLLGASGSNNSFCKKYKVQASNDGTTFDDIYEETLSNELISKCVFLASDTIAYKYYRIVVEESYHSTYYGITSFFPMYVDFDSV